MIRINYTTDSKRPGEQGECASLAELRRIISQKSGRGDVAITPFEAAGYVRGWEVAVNETVIAFAYDMNGHAPDPGTRKLHAAAAKHADYLESTLIPDLRASGRNFTADDLARCVGFMRALMGIEEGMDECAVCHKRFNATRRDKSPICRGCK